MSSIRRIIAVAVTLVLATIISYNGNLDGNLDTYHEGERLAYFDALESGKLPYRDIFVQHGLGEDIIKPWAACKLWGDSVESLRRLGENAYVYRGYLPPLGVATLILAAAALVRRMSLVVLVGIAASVTFCEATDRHMLGFIAMALMGLFFSRGKSVWLGLAAIATVLALMYSVEVGLYTLAACFISLIVHGVRTTGGTSRRFTMSPHWRYPAAVVCALAALMAACARVGIAGPFLRNVAIQLFHRRELFGRPYPWPVWIPDAPAWASVYDGAQIILLFYGIPALGLAGAIYFFARFRRLDRHRRAALALTNVLLLCFWASVWGLPEHWHAASAVPAFLLFSAVLLDTVMRAPDAQDSKSYEQERGSAKSVSTVRVSTWATAFALPTLALVAVGEGGALGRKLFGHEVWHLPDFLQNHDKALVESGLDRVGRCHIQQGQADYLRTLIHHIQGLAGLTDPILDLSNQGLLYFLSRRPCATRFYFAAHVGPSVTLQWEVIRELVGNPQLPHCVIRMIDDHPAEDPLHAFVGRYYVREAVVGRTEVLRCIDPRAHRRPGR